MRFWSTFGGVLLALLAWDMIHEITFTWLDTNTLLVRVGTIVAILIIGAVIQTLRAEP